MKFMGARFTRRGTMIATIAAAVSIAAVFAWWWTQRREHLANWDDVAVAKKWVWNNRGEVMPPIMSNQMAFDRLKSRSELSPKVNPASCRRFFEKIDPNPSKYDLNVLQFVVDQGARMMQYLNAHPKYKNYEYTKNLQRWDGSVFASLEETGGVATGTCVGVQLRFRKDVDVPYEMSAARLNTKLLHEMAHFAGPGGHREYFAQANRWLVNIATKELGWRVALKCAACHRSGICANDCPKCEWWENPKTCDPYKPV